MDLDNFYELAKNAKKASKKLATLSTDIKNKALLSIAEEFENHKSQIFEANKKDLLEADFVIITESAINEITERLQ